MSYKGQRFLTRLMSAAALLALLPAVPAQNPAEPGSSAPRLLEKAEPEYTQEARAEGIEGIVVLQGEVSEQGMFENMLVVKGLGYGLDEKAQEAVAQWVFEPGREDGAPKRVPAKIEVNFRL